jgi:hypothetical protein
MRTTIRRSDTQEWFRFSDDKWERLCCDLHGLQKEISTCQLHGTRGQRDKGVDHIAQRKDGGGIEVGQSKCYKEFNENDLETAVKPFFINIDLWKDKKIRRYILFVACDIQRMQVHDEKEVQRKRFDEEGIIFEVWSARDIERKLGPHRNVVERYIHSKEIVNNVCGSPAPDIPTTEFYRRIELDLEASGSQRLQLADALSKSKLEKLEELREQYRQGKHQHALEGVLTLYNEGQGEWKLLDKFTRGKILRILALYFLNVESNVEKAIEIAAIAKENDPDGDDTILQTVLAYHRDGPEAALPIIENLSTLDGINLHASLLFQLGKNSKVLELLADLPNDIKPNAETKRIQALSFLVSGDLSNARIKIDEAAAEKPNWHSILVTKAIIDYWNAISPTALKNTNPLIPLPISHDLVKRDKDSLDILSSAEKEFYNLTLNDELSSNEKRMLNAWRIATLAMHPDRQDDAENFCRHLMVSDLVDSYALRWALSRNYDIDKQSIESIISEVLKTRNKDLDLVGILIGFCLETKNQYDAFRLLNKYEHRFNDMGHYDIWLFWRTHALIASEKKLSDTKKTIALVEDPQIKDRLRTTILEIQYKRSRDSKPLLAHLESLYSETDNGIYLLEACRLKASLKDYDYVLKRGDDLIKKIGTPTALYLTIESAWKKKQWTKCLALLDKHTYLFSGGVLPDDLRRLRVNCQIELGFLNKSLEDAKTLVETTESIENITTLMQAQLSLGDLAEIKKSSVKLLAMKDVPPLELLRAANVVQLEDERLAVILWEKAIEREIDDPELLKAAIETGYSLGLDQKMVPLQTKVSEFISKGRGDFQTVNFRDLIDMRKQELTQRQNVIHHYNQGNIPVHLITTKPLGLSLARLYSEYFSQCLNNPDPLRQLPLLARHGSRRLHDYKGVEPGKRRLNLDITALFLATQLEMLEIIERTFKKIRIPASTQFFLINETKMLKHRQPSRIKDMSKVDELFKLGALNVFHADYKCKGEENAFTEAMGEEWMNVLVQVEQEEGYLVDFLPLHSNDINYNPVDIPANYRRFITGPKGLIDSLCRDHVLSDGKCLKILNEMSNLVEGESDSPLPKAGSAVFLMGTLPETLATFGLLDKLCSHFKIIIQQVEIDRIRDELLQNDKNSKLRDWIDCLRERLKTGLENGTYEIITLDDGTDSRIYEKKGLDEPALQPLLELLTFLPKSEDVICYDDRNLSSYSNSNGAAIIGITDILMLLKEFKSIDEATYFAKILGLRKGNMRYIPFSKEEILYHLNQAEIKNGQVLETHELSALRRYWAACLLDTDRLQCPPKPDRPKHEAGFVVWSMRAVQDAITKCWNEGNKKEEVAIAYSDWILFNLYTPLFGIRHLLNDPDPQSDRKDLIGMDLGSLVSSAIGLMSVAPEGQDSVQSRYLRWLSSRVVSRRLKADPEVVPASTRIIRSLCDSTLLENKNTKTRKNDIDIYLIQKFILNIPQKFRDELHQYQAFMTKIGLRSADFVNIGNVSFLASDYWKAATEAVNRRPQKILAHDPPVEFKIQRVERDRTDHIVLKIFDEGNKYVWNFTDPFLGILSDDPDQRLNTVRENRHMLDYDSNTMQKIEKKLANIQNPVSRIQHLLSAQEESATFYYEKFTQKVSKHDSIKFDEFLPPSPECLLKHFRLIEGDFKISEDFSSVWTRAVDTLLADEILHKVLDRIVCVPIRLTENLFQAFERLENSERRDIILKAEQRWSSPISLLHLVDIALHFAGDDKVLLQVAKRDIERLWGEESGKKEFELFITFLKYFEAEFSKWKKYRSMPVAARLFCIWAHSARLQNIFGAAGADIKTLVKNLESKIKPVSYTLFNLDVDYLQDVLNPSCLRQAHITFQALSFILKGHENGLIDSIGIREIAKALFDAFFRGENADILGLLSDSQLYTDSLNSLLGGDRDQTLSCLIGPEAAKNFSSTFLHKAVRNSISQISKDNKYHPGWTNLVAIVGNRPLYDDLTDDFFSILSSMDLVSLYEANPLTFAIALPMMCEQVGYLGDKPLLDHLIGGLIKVAEKIKKDMDSYEKGKMDSSQPSSEDILMFLIDAVYKISIHQGDQRKASKFFSDLVGKLFNISPFLAKMFREPLLHMVSQLPADQIHGLWRLLLISRAL